MFSGRIKGIGPRYCPSVEDKINRFADKDRHQIFVEPEGWDTVEVYVNGFSTSLPEDVQYAALRKIPGFENAKMFRPGYAIEYDYFPPTQLKSTLETHLIQNLFFAGQINGTTGYEEAACQGLMAGINAHQNVHDLEPFVLKRSEAYIGVLIDDLINKGTEEPYRMFTSRAEYRTLLRQDNADIRLTEKGFNLGLADQQRLDNVQKKKSEVAEIIAAFNNNKLTPDEINPTLEAIGTAPLREKISLAQLLKRPQISIDQLTEASPVVQTLLEKFGSDSIHQAEINLKYDSYIEKEMLLVEKMNRLEDLNIIENFNYDVVTSLSFEGREKLKRTRPGTIGQASRISGVSPSDISVLMLFIGR